MRWQAAIARNVCGISSATWISISGMSRRWCCAGSRHARTPAAMSRREDCWIGSHGLPTRDLPSRSRAAQGSRGHQCVSRCRGGGPRVVRCRSPTPGAAWLHDRHAPRVAGLHRGDRTGVQRRGAHGMGSRQRVPVLSAHGAPGPGTDAAPVRPGVEQGAGAGRQAGGARLGRRDYLPRAAAAARVSAVGGLREGPPGSAPAPCSIMRAARRTTQRRRSRSWSSRAARPTPMPWR